MHPTARTSRARFSVPRPRQRALDRPQLQQRLVADALPPLTLITAPSGFGKTTLAARAAHGLGPPWRHAWIGFDLDNGNALDFLHATVGALRHADAHLAPATASLLERPEPAPARELALQLCDDLMDAHAPVLLVLDDYQFVDHAAVNSVLAVLVDHMPPLLRVLLLSRRTPALPLAAWRARALLTEIDQQDLRFTPAETERFLNWTMELALPPPALQALDDHVEGWVAGLQMAALSLQLRRGRLGDQAPASQALAFRGSHRFVIDYVRQEVLAAQPAAVRSFLRQTAMLHTLTPGLCDAVTGRSDGQAMLCWLDQSNMFIVRLDDERPWYRYHALFREALSAELGVAELKLLHGRAFAWYQAHGVYQEAFHHAWQADDIDGCASAMHHLFEEMLCRGEVRAVELMLAALPQAAFERHAELALQQAWVLHLTGSAQRAAQAVALARLDRADEHPPAVRGAVHAFRAYLALNWGDPAATGHWARLAIAHLPPSSPYFGVLVLTYLGQAQTLHGQRVAALATHRQAHELGQRVGNHAKAQDALVHLVLLLLEQGRVLQARQLATAAIAQHRGNGRQPLPMAGLAHVALGAVHLACNELDSGRDLLRTGVELARKVGVLYFVLLGQCLLARLLHARGDRDDAWEVLAAAREAADASGGPRRRGMVARTLAELKLLEGHADAAAALLAAAAPSAPLAADAAANDADALLQAWVLVGQRRHDSALRLLARSETLARQDGFDGSLVLIGVLQCLCHQALGGRQAALAALQRALALAASAQLRRPFMDHLPDLLPLLADGHVRGVAPAFVDSLAPAGSGALPPALVAAAAAADPLSHREVELLQLINRGMRNQEIANQLSITVGTTKQYLNHLFGKLGARNRVEAILLGRRLRILP